MYTAVQQKDIVDVDREYSMTEVVKSCFSTKDVILEFLCTCTILCTDFTIHTMYQLHCVIFYMYITYMYYMYYVQCPMYNVIVIRCVS